MDPLTDGFAELTLETRDLAALERFYVDGFGLRGARPRGRPRLARRRAARPARPVDAGGEGVRRPRRPPRALRVLRGARAGSTRWPSASCARRDGARPEEHDGGDRSLYVEDPEGNVVEVWDFFGRGRAGRGARGRLRYGSAACRRASAWRSRSRGGRCRCPTSTRSSIRATGFTKGHVIDYYTRIAPVLLPHLRGRHLTLKRYPNGVEGDFFYEKQCPAHRPDWVRTAGVWSRHNGREIDYCMVDDLADDRLAREPRRPRDAHAARLRATRRRRRRSSRSTSTPGRRRRSSSARRSPAACATRSTTSAWSRSRRRRARRACRSTCR